MDIDGQTETQRKINRQMNMDGCMDRQKGGQTERHTDE